MDPYPFDTRERREKAAFRWARLCPRLVNWKDLEEALIPRRRYTYLWYRWEVIEETFDGFDYPEPVG
jgi:hypothetical protein